MYKLYSMQRSGNCYKVRLALEQLGIPHDIVDIDILKGDSRTPDFLAKNPSGQIPLLEMSPGRFLPESNAILCFLGEGTPLLSSDPLVRAETLQWLFFEQHAIVPNIAAAYFWLVLVKGGRELQQYALDDWFEEGHRALRVMDKHLADRAFFAGEQYSIADIALYAYTHRAPECDFDLRAYGAIREWLDRVANQPAHITMEQVHAPLQTAAE